MRPSPRRGGPRRRGARDRDRLRLRRHPQQLGKARVLIVDWDVHHGNGTQALVERDASLRYVSMHQYPWYPGTGAEDERGVGNVFNVPRPPGLPRQLYARDLLAAVDAALEGWPPDLLLVSAGFDSLNGDPLGGFTLEPEDMARWTALLRQRVAPAPVVGVLEGGYRLDLLAAGARAHVRALARLGRPPRYFSRDAPDAHRRRRHAEDEAPVRHRARGRR